MVRRTGEIRNMTAQTITINERHPSSLGELTTRYTESSGLVVNPSDDVSLRTDITGYVLTSYNSQGKAIWAPSSGGGGGGGGSGSPAGTLQGAIQLRNTDGTDFEADDSLLWSSGTSTLSVPGTLTGTTLSTTGGISATGSVIVGVTRLGGLTNPPVNSSDAASKAYVDSIAGSGVSWKNPVVYASTATSGSSTDGNFLLTGQADSALIDGIGTELSTLIDGQRVLLKNQLSPGQNSIYDIVVPGTGGVGFVNFIMSSDITGTKASGSAVFVEKGVTQADQGFVVTDIVGTDLFGTSTSITWGQFTSSASISAAGIVNEIQYNDGASGLDASSDFKYTDGSQLLQVGNVTDNGVLQLAANKLSFIHNGTNGEITNNLGTLTLGNSTRDVIVADVIINSGNLTASSVLFKEDSGTEFITLKAPTGVTLNYDMILPNVAGGDKQMLYSNSSQELSWNYPNQNYKISNVVAGSGVGEYNTGSFYSVQPGDRFVYVEESSTTPVASVAINLPLANSTLGMIVTIADKGGLSSNTTLGTIEIHADGADVIQGWNGSGFSVQQLDLAFADYVGYTLISDGVSLWHVIA